MPFSNYMATRTLNWLRGVANGATTPAPGMPSAPTTLYISLHSGNPGVNGTSSDVTTSIATGRGSIASTAWTAPTASTSPASGFQISNASSVTITSSAIGSATVTHFGIWDSATGGNFLEYGTLTSQLAVISGDAIAFAIGQLILRHV